MESFPVYLSWCWDHGTKSRVTVVLQDSELGQNTRTQDRNGGGGGEGTCRVSYIKNWVLGDLAWSWAQWGPEKEAG